MTARVATAAAAAAIAALTAAVAVREARIRHAHNDLGGDD